MSRSLFLGLIGAPYESDLFTSAMRIADAAVRAGHDVTVWTCGFATSLTVADAPEHKPRNVLSWDTRYPTPAALARHLVDTSAGRLSWLVCRYCAEERATLRQLDMVRVRPPYEFAERALAADRCLVLGTK